MTGPVQNADTSTSFFQAVAQSFGTNDLISAQVDPSQPQVDGLATVTDPIVPDQRVIGRITNFDPNLFDLSEDSHLMRLLKALLGASGIGGLRRQILLTRLSATSLSGTHFFDLDTFWGSLFSIGRSVSEQNPTQPDGSSFNPATDAATSDTWDAMTSADGRYRSRIMALAKAFNYGATYSGIVAAAEAVLGCEVDIIESWNLADQVPVGSLATTINSNTYQVIVAQYGTYGGMTHHSWGLLQGGTTVPGDAPLGNRGEVVVTPKRPITEDERRQVSVVLDALRPSGVLLTVLSNPIVTYSLVQPRSMLADSNDWQVTNHVTQFQGLSTPDVDVYPDQSDVEGARPAFGRYSGEKWSYNSRISKVSSYQMIDEVPLDQNPDDQTVTFLDGTTHTYVSGDAVVSAKQAILGRLAAEGVMTTYPYAPGRAS